MNRYYINKDRNNEAFNIFNIPISGIDEFDNNSDSVSLMKRKFWGKGEWTVSSPCIEIGNSGVGRKTYVRKVYVLWMTVGYENEYRNCTDF